VTRVHKVLQISSLVTTLYAYQLTIALRMTLYSLYTIKLRDCTLFEQQAYNVFFVSEKACKNLDVLISNCDSVSKKVKFADIP